MTCIQEVNIIVLQPSWEVHPLQPTLMWNLITIPAVGSLRETAVVPGMLSLVLSEQQSSSTQRSEAELEPFPTPSSAPDFVCRSQCSRACAHSFTVSAEKVSYLLNLPFYSFWAQNQFREPD